MGPRFSQPVCRATQRAPIACLYLCGLVGCGSSEPGSDKGGLAGVGPSDVVVTAGGGRAISGRSGLLTSARGGQSALGSSSIRSTVGNGGAPVERSYGSNFQTGGAPEHSGLGGTSTGGSSAKSTSANGTSKNSHPGGAGAGGTTTVSKTAGTSSAGAATGGRSSSGASTGGSATAAGGTTGGNTARSNLCPAGVTRTISVAKDGGAEYITVQSAVDSIANNSSAAIRIDIKAGTYTEKLTIANRSNLCLVGEDANTTILTYGDSNGTVGSTSGSASVHVSANDFSAARLTFRNSYGAGSQAVALRTTGQRQQFLDCRLVGYQDTLYVHSGTQYFRNCYVQGNTDYVFGGATAVLQDCEVRNVQKGSAVAAPNTASSTAYGIVFLGGHFSAEPGISNVALARPWGADGAAAFLDATLDGHISAAGFTIMSGNDPVNARFSEYRSTGSGANAPARSGYQLTAADAAKYTIASIYGGAWTPSYSQ